MSNRADLGANPRHDALVGLTATATRREVSSGVASDPEQSNRRDHAEIEFGIGVVVGAKPMACEFAVATVQSPVYTADARRVLPGGNTTGAVLIDGVVHKRASPWTPTVHAVLRHLEEAGVDGVPRALGFDDQGREMLTYLPGRDGRRPVPWPAGRRRLDAHPGRPMAATASTTRQPASCRRPDERWFTGRTMGPV